MLELLSTITVPRAVGTEGNNEVLKFGKQFFEKNGYTVKSMPFSCLVWSTGESYVEWAGKKQPVLISPYSKGFCGKGIVKRAGTVEELEKLDCEGTVLFLTDEIVGEQLQPKDYPFYYPDEHKRINDLLEEKKPSAIVAVTGKSRICGQDPYPLIEDGNFKVPAAYMSIGDFEKIKDEIIGKDVEVHLVSECKEVESEQIYANKSVKDSKGKVVICAHMDSKNQTLGALDNASGTAVLLKLAQMLKPLKYDIDLVPFNTEEYFGANGELLYLEELQKNGDDVTLMINMDSVGHIGSRAAVSVYNMPEMLNKSIKELVDQNEWIEFGPEWYAGDHAMFVFQGTPCIAVASSDMYEGGLSDTHTMRDTVDTVDDKVLMETASFLETVVSLLEKN